MTPRLVSERMQRRTRRVTLNIFLWIFVAIVMALVAVAVLAPGMAKRAGEAPAGEGLAPETPMDWLPLPFVGLALVLCVVMLVRTRGRADRRPAWVLMTFLLAWLAWRELPWDEYILNDANTFSWAKYLDDPEVPLLVRIVFGGGSMAAAVLMIVYVCRRARAVGRLLREKLRMSSGWLVAAGLGLLAAAQVCDKYSSIDKRLGTDLAALKEAGWLGYVEESLELLGPVLLVMACIMGMIEERQRGERMG